MNILSSSPAAYFKPVKSLSLELNSSIDLPEYSGSDLNTSLITVTVTGPDP